MTKSSINFERIKRVNFRHNDRSQEEPDYLLPKSFVQYENEFSCSADEAEVLLEELLWDARFNYKDLFGQKLQAKTYLWEAVVNLNEEHTLEDVQQLAEVIEKETCFTTLQVAVHRDEGYIDEGGEPRYNFHAHIVFFTLDRETGQQLYRRQMTKKQKEKQPDLKPMNREKLSKLQDLTAETLGMQRGQKGTGRPHLTPKQFREFKVLENELEEYKYNFYQSHELVGTIDPSCVDGVRYDFKHRAEIELEKLKKEFESLKEQNQKLSMLLGEKDVQIDLLQEQIPESEVHQGMSPLIRG